MLVATNVAARGLDISNVELVIQTDIPQNFDEYIHRSGRTGRAGKQGTCVTLMNKRGMDKLSQLEKLIKTKVVPINFDSFTNNDTPLMKKSLRPTEDDGEEDFSWNKNKNYWGSVPEKNLGEKMPSSSFGGTEQKLFVGNLEDSVSEEDLRDFFNSKGLSPKNVKVVRKEGKCGFGFVILRSSDAEKALELRSPELKGKRLTIQKPKNN